MTERHGEKNSLAITHPELALEWHPTKNGTLTPKDITKGNTRPVWWKGKCGHEWQVSVNSRTNKKTGCPYCAGNKVLVGFNDLNSQKPELASEWHPTKNGNLRPEDVFVNSRKKVWWLGKCGHEWPAAIHTRSERGYGCPFCAHKKLLPGFNDLATTHPEIAKDWHPTKNGLLQPSDVIAGTHKRVWWKCSLCGHEWKTTPNSRVDGKKCPKCAKRNAMRERRKILVQNKGSLAQTNPILLDEWDRSKNGLLNPEEITIGYNGTVWWKGKCGHTWPASIRDRNKGIGCPYCSNKKLLVGYNDLETKRPDIAKEWNYSKNILKPSDVISGSDKSVWWKCQICGNEWEAKIVSRIRGAGCPKCAFEKSTSYPEQAIYYYLKKLYPDAINRYLQEGNELDVYIPSVFIGIEYDGEYYHSDKKRYIEERKTDYYEKQGINIIRIKESDTLSTIKKDIIYYVPKSSYITLDEVIERLIQVISEKTSSRLNIDINNQRDMMSIMSNYVSGIKTNSIATVKPELMDEWNYEKNQELKPYYISANSNKKVWWKCKNGHEWPAKIYSRTRGSGCPYCNNKRAWPGYNDLATTKPDLASEWDYEKNGVLKPTDILAGSSKKVWWKCNICSYEWPAEICNRSKGSGCPKCARSKVKTSEQVK